MGEIASVIRHLFSKIRFFFRWFFTLLWEPSRELIGTALAERRVSTTARLHQQRAQQRVTYSITQCIKTEPCPNIKRFNYAPRFVIESSSSSNHIEDQDYLEDYCTVKNAEG
jgi:hypothetical protein